jgi:hypothetical protein
MNIRWLALCCALSCCVTTTFAQIAFKEKPKQINVEIDGQLFTSFHFDEKWPKPFFHPLRAPDGTVVTRGFPLEKNEGESDDHHWHRGLWFAHGDINGVDFWRETSGIEAQDKKLPLPVGRLVLESAPQFGINLRRGTLQFVAGLVAPDNKTLGTLREQYAFQKLGKHYAINVRVTIQANHGVALKMGDTEEGLLGFRFADAFKEERGATLLNSEGLKGTKNIWGKRARWVDYSTAINNQAMVKTVGVAIFDHPSNPKHPTYWHARGYGLNAANPFGEHDFHDDKMRDGSVTIPANGKLTFRYRVIVHNGDAAASKLEELYQAFAKSN